MATSGLASRRSGSGPSRATIALRSSTVPIEHAVGPGEVDRRPTAAQAHAHLADHRGLVVAEVHAELAEQPEVHVPDGRPFDQP